jgi:outer membrane biosynthesis protein TonB
MVSLLSQIVAFFLACLSCYGVLWLMSQNKSSTAPPIQEHLVRPIVTLPPPPPPPESQVQPVQQALTLPRLSSTPQTNSSITLKTAPLDSPIQLEFNPMVQLNTSTQFDMDLETEVGAALKTDFKFEDMDQAPQLIHHGNFRFKFPSDLQRRGVTQGKVELLVVIDPQGRARVLEVVSASYRQLIPIAKKMVAMARYSPPQVNGKAVNVTGVWPVILNAPKR